MRKYDFESIVDRSNTSAAKTNASIIKYMLNLNYYDDTISMWVADMDFATAPQIIESIKNRADKLIMGYTIANDDYYNSIINWYKKRHNMLIKKEWLVFSHGTIEGLRNSIRALTKEGDGIIIQPPVYFPFEGNVKETGRKVVRNTLIKNENNGYSIDFEDFEEKCKDPNTKMFIYCNPHNPIGKIWSKEDTQRLLDICNENNVIFFSDEIHSDLIRKDSEFTSALNLNNNEKVIVATALNKTFNVAGLHMTNLVIKNDDMRNKLNSYTGWVGMSPLVLEATISAYNECEDWVVEVNEVIDENLVYMESFLAEKLPRVKFTKPEGTYLTWLDFNDYPISEKELLKKLADEAHLVLEGGSMFGTCGEGFIRMNVACPKSVLKEALDRLEKAI